MGLLLIYILEFDFFFIGADAILMHSKKADPSDIEAFMKAWNNQVCIIINKIFCFMIMLLIYWAK